VNYRKLGTSDLIVSDLAVGCFSMTQIYGNPDPQAGIDTINRAIELGITHFDTADTYGDGANEELVGPVFKPMRDKLVVATKFGQVKHPDGTRSINGRPEYVRQACEASLKRLGMDYIDLYYQHRVDATVPVEETVGEMKRLVEEGKVRTIGLSEASPETVRRAHKIHPITAIQMEYSLWTRFVEDEHLPQCEELGIALVGYAPIGRGFLSGSVRSAADLGDDGDTRGNHPRFNAENLENNVRQLKPIEDMARDKGCTMAQLAIAWVRDKGNMVFPLAGSGKRVHLEENIKAMDLPLSELERQALSDAIDLTAIAGERYPPGMMEHLNV